MAASEEAVAFCRNHFVVDGLTWLKTPPTDTVAPAGAPRLRDNRRWSALLPGFMGALAFAVAVVGMRARQVRTS